MEIDEDRSDFEKDEEEDDDSVSDLLRDRFRLSAISIAEYEGPTTKRNSMEISQPIVACITDLTFEYIGLLAKDLDLFAPHAGRKSVKICSLPFSAHRNEHLAASLRSFRDELKGKEPQCERKRKKVLRKDDKAIEGIVHIPDL
ncbi:protein MHF1 homolog [Hibiscus syriacus]|uniref:protein MHF1 homolog n=1 Tax=Hibiscus syriacus TaxID=106335 RepID=UPI00192498E4|nr:protein MHF1 homolog [Hibiscus syriacus]